MLGGSDFPAGFGAPLDELSISRERIQKDPQGRERYLVIAVKKDVLAEYESVLHSLGWRTGLILPRHLGEAQWLVRNGVRGDSLLLSGFGQGFTGERGEAGQTLAEQTDAALVQVIGRVVVLYRRRCKDDPKRPRIELATRPSGPGPGTIR